MNYQHCLESYRSQLVSETMMPLSRAEKITCDNCSYDATDGNIAAIDFGTTSVSLAYTTKGYENVNTLPLETGDRATRVLSVILLKKIEAKLKVAAFGRDATKKFSVLKSADYEKHIYFERIKMLLKREQVYQFFIYHACIH